MIDRTLIERSTRTIAIASVWGIPYRSVRSPTTPVSTMPIPAGVSGTAVSSEPASATKKAPLRPRCTPGKSNVGQGEPNTILSGVVHLAEDGAWPLAALVFFASFVVPITKIGALALLSVTVQRGSSWRLRDRTILYRVTEAVGAWSMIDIFLVGILVSLVRMDALASVRPDIGATFFAAAVVLTMLAAHSFDPRLVWDRAGKKA